MSNFKNGNVLVALEKTNVNGVHPLGTMNAYTIFHSRISAWTKVVYQQQTLVSQSHSASMAKYRQTTHELLLTVYFTMKRDLQQNEHQQLLYLQC